MLDLKPNLVTAGAKVTLTYPEMPDFKLQMDFNPIIERFRLRGQFCLVHWQAKPFGQRRWGVYDGGSDNYVAFKDHELELQVTGQPLQVDENLIKTVPTAVFWFPNSKLVKNDYYSINPV